MQAISFSWAVGLVYGYLLVLLLEVLYERRFKSKRWLRPLGVTVITAVAALFIFGYVYARDPLKIRTRNLTGEKAAGTQIAGITWKPEYSDIRIVFQNNTDNDYRNLDFVLTTGHLITAEGSTISTGPVSVYNTITGPDVVTMTMTSEGKKTVIPDNRTVFFSGGVRVTCDKLMKHGGVFEIVLAIAQPPEVPKAAFDSSGKLIPGFIMLLTVDKGEFPYGPRVNITTVDVNGSYESLGGRLRKVHDSFSVEQN